MEAALEKGGSENPVLVEHYGDILYMMGDKQRAVENWRKAKKLGDGSEMLDRKIKESRYIESNKP
jgi:predicted negative regulator of RcsB-dependent stress response